jgi:hypothetical protein
MVLAAMADAAYMRYTSTRYDKYATKMSIREVAKKVPANVGTIQWIELEETKLAYSVHPKRKSE